MDTQTDLRSWKVFRSLDSAFIANIRMAMVVGKGQAGIIVLRNDDVFIMGQGTLLGMEGIEAPPVPTKVAAISGLKIKGISGGSNFVNVLTENGHLFTAGSNDVGQLGLGEDIDFAHVPTRLHLPNDEPVVEVACGACHTLALTASGRVYSWGLNEHGQVNKFLPEEVWTPVDALMEDGLGRSKVVSVACGGVTSFVLRDNGTVWTWGCSFQTGSLNIIEPTMIPLDVGISKIVGCSLCNVLMLDKKGSLHFFGAWPPVAPVKKPIAVPAEVGQVLDIAATWHSSLSAFRTKSGVYFWGEWLEQNRECPSASNFPSMHLLFALDKGEGHDSVMCRPWMAPKRKDKRQETPPSETLNTGVPTADLEFKLRDGRLVHAHRVVLLQSPYFIQKLNGDWAESLSFGLTQVPMHDVDPDSFQSFLHYLYKGRLDQPLLQDGPERYKRVLEFLRTAHKFEHGDLLADCKGILLSLVNAENACEMFQVASELNLKDLERRAVQAMATSDWDITQRLFSIFRDFEREPSVLENGDTTLVLEEDDTPSVLETGPQSVPLEPSEMTTREIPLPNGSSSLLSSATSIWDYSVFEPSQI